MEPGWSKVKQHPRSEEARTPETLPQPDNDAFDTITATDAKRRFRRGGYAVR